jgi:stage III sporulation protein AA
MSDAAYETIIGMMPKGAAEKLSALDPALASEATEIRLRAGRPCAVCCGGRARFIELRGQPLAFSQADIRAIVAHMCEYSLYRREEELRSGYITVKGGHRLGVCATMLQSGSVDISSISSVSIRIAREHRGCAAEIFGAAMLDGLCSVLVAGAPLSGKTTILRDLARILSSRPLYHKVVLIDERGELAGIYRGTPSLDIGVCCDVLDGYPRPAAFDIALRTLSPEIIICDELGCEEDCKNIADAARGGVKVLASAHAGSLDGLMRRASLARCVEGGVFDKVAFLEGPPRIGALREIREATA